MTDSSSPEKMAEMQELVIPASCHVRTCKLKQQTQNLVQCHQFCTGECENFVHPACYHSIVDDPKYDVGCPLDKELVFCSKRCIRKWASMKKKEKASEQEMEKKKASSHYVMWG
jgi:hypothetical protein